MILGRSITKNFTKFDKYQLSSFRAISRKPVAKWTPNGQYHDFKDSIIVPVSALQAKQIPKFHNIIGKCERKGSILGK